MTQLSAWQQDYPRGRRFSWLVCSCTTIKSTCSDNTSCAALIISRANVYHQTTRTPPHRSHKSHAPRKGHPDPQRYYRKRGSASYIVRDFCERERERERETPVTSIDITLISRVIMHMITSTARRPNASTRSEPVECSCTCIRQGAWCLSARAAGNGRVIDE